LESALQPKNAKINKTAYFGSSGSFKVTNFDMTEKLITSDCCDRQHAHGDLQLFSQKTGQQQQNNNFPGVPLFDALMRRFL